jgi:2-methylaconitate cis-trans-isomerase PrpF
LAKENCFSIRGGSAENQFFHTENLPRSKREEFVFHWIRVEAAECSTRRGENGMIVTR